MASGDFTKIGASNLDVVADVDNQSSPNVMKKTTGSGAGNRVWFQSDTAGSIGDSWIKVSAKIDDGGAGASSLLLALRTQAALDLSDMYYLRITEDAGTPSGQASLIRVVSTVETNLVSVTPFAPPGGDEAWNDHRFSIATDGSAVKLRYEIATVGGGYSTIIDYEDLDAARITAAGKVRFGAEIGAETGHVVRIDDFDAGTLA